MTQRAIYSKDRIVEAAVTLTREHGWAAVTARNLAKQLSCSTMPIYSSLKSMGGIEREVRRRAEDLMLDCQRKHYTHDSALNAALGYVNFARSEPNLFRFLYVDRPVRMRRGDIGREAAVSSRDVFAGTRIPRLADQVPTAMRDPRILKCWIFIHGLASMIGTGVLDLTERRIKSLIIEAGGALFGPRGGEQ
ncbi:MAG TPA: WHG domain-containing protein [Acidobacteriota bacterium]|nr:WHG domain-containing protein [Acidobacteriota bacterium]